MDDPFADLLPKQEADPFGDLVPHKPNFANVRSGVQTSQQPLAQFSGGFGEQPPDFGTSAEAEARALEASEPTRNRIVSEIPSETAGSLLRGGSGLLLASGGALGAMYPTSPGVRDEAFAAADKVRAIADSLTSGNREPAARLVGNLVGGALGGFLGTPADEAAQTLREGGSLAEAEKHNAIGSMANLAGVAAGMLGPQTAGLAAYGQRAARQVPASMATNAAADVLEGRDVTPESLVLGAGTGLFGAAFRNARDVALQGRLGPEAEGVARADVILDSAPAQPIPAEATGNPITSRLEEKLQNHEAALQEYASLPDSRGGTVLNTDVARELSPDYLSDRTKSADVHEPASAFIKRVYAQKLAEPTPEGMEPKVVFTAGGTGAGKTTGLNLAGDALGKPEIVYDTNMNTFESAKAKIEQALNAPTPRDVTILYTYRDPAEALRNGALKRAARQEAEFGTGRTVPIEEHVKTHVGAYDVVNRLAQEYNSDPRVSILAVDNSRGQGNAQIVPLEEIPNPRTEGLSERLQQELEAAHGAGEISDAVRAGFEAKSSRVEPEGGTGVRERPEPPEEGLEDRGPSSEPLNLDIPFFSEEAAPSRKPQRLLDEEVRRSQTGPSSVSMSAIPETETVPRSIGASVARIKGAAEVQERVPTPKADSGQINLPPRLREQAAASGEPPGSGNPTLPSRTKELLKARGIWDSAADVLRRSPDFKPLGDAVVEHYDAMQRRQGEASQFLREPVKAATKEDRASFEAYQAAVQNNRPAPALTPRAKKLVDAWRGFAEHSGAENQRVGVQVFDPKTESYRLIGRSKDFFPRVLKEEFQQAMRDPNKHPEAWGKMVDALLESGHIKTREEAGRFLNDHYSDTSSNDYFAGIEKARTQPLPESLYDYSLNAGLKYANRWAERLSQIEHFGQKLGPKGKDLFDTMMGKTTDEGTKAYIDAVSKVVYNVRSKDSFAKAAQTLNTLATGLQLGNPATSALNVIGGLFQNASTFGVSRAVRALTELKGAAKHIKDAHDIGVLRGDYLDIIHDADALDVNKRLQGFTSKMLKYGGYELTEATNRLHSYLMAKDFLRSATKSLEKNPLSESSKQYLRFIQRVGSDYEKLLSEKGKGPETEAFYRKAVNESQFSYNLSQTPVWANTAVGKFLFKYQKFGLQMSRYYWQNIMEPLGKALVGKEKVKVRDPATGQMVEARVGAARPLLNMLRYWAGAAVAGNAILGIREMLFGYQNNAPDMSEIDRALADDRTVDALWLAAKRAWVGNLAIGGLGFFSNYVQMSQDIADRQRVKNPLNPPGIAPLTGLANLGLTLFDQKGEGIGRALDDFVTQNVSMYRTGKRLGGLLVGSEKEQATRDVAFTKKMTRRYADERGIEAKRRAPSDTVATPMTPVNKDINDALILGDAHAARQTALEYLRKLDKPERKSAIASMKSSIRFRQPTTVSVAPSAAQRRDFLTWAKANLMDEEYQRIIAIEQRYSKASSRFEEALKEME